MEKLWVENISTPARIYQVNSPNENFVDMSYDIIEWDKSIYIMDWSRRRDMISPLFYAEAGSQLQNFGGMSIEKKLLACKYFLIPYSVRTSIITENEDKLNGEYLLSQTESSRVECVEAMRQYIWNAFVRNNLITLAQSQQMFDDIDEENKIRRFEKSNKANLKKWIFGLSPYEGVFVAKNYYSISMQDGLVSIYNGAY